MEQELKNQHWLIFFYYHCKDLSGIGGQLRPGIVHRLDKETSGVMIIAKNDESHISISNQFARQRIKRHIRQLLVEKLKTLIRSYFKAISDEIKKIERKFHQIPLLKRGYNILEENIKL